MLSEPCGAQRGVDGGDGDGLRAETVQLNFLPVVVAGEADKPGVSERGAVAGKPLPGHRSRVTLQRETPRRAAR